MKYTKMQSPGDHYKSLKIVDDSGYDIFTYTFKDDFGAQIMYPGTSVGIPEISVYLKKRNDWDEETYYGYYYTEILARFLVELMEAKDVAYSEIDTYFTKMMGMPFHTNLLFQHKWLSKKIREVIDARNERLVENTEIFKGVDTRNLNRNDIQWLSKKWDALFSVAMKRSKSFRELDDKQEKNVAESIAKIVIAAKEIENT